MRTTPLLLVTALLVLAGCTDEPRSRQALDVMGFTEIAFTGYGAFACSEDDHYATGFTAKNPLGKPVSGVVCCGISEQLRARSLDISQACWRPSIHQPRWAARPLLLDVLSVRAERLQDITEEDAKAEGVDMAQFRTEVPGRAAPLMSPDNYRAGFVALWDTINGHKAPWHSNPWIWRLELRRVEST
jgi:hypothetical protein